MEKIVEEILLGKVRNILENLLEEILLGKVILVKWHQKCNSFPPIGELLSNCSIPPPKPHLKCSAVHTGVVQCAKCSFALFSFLHSDGELYGCHCLSLQ